MRKILIISGPALPAFFCDALTAKLIAIPIAVTIAVAKPQYPINSAILVNFY